jgi:aspartate/methionine/tyrosine aminotransferase
VKSSREEWAARYGLAVDPVRHVTVTSGATEALFDIIMALIEPGDDSSPSSRSMTSYPAGVHHGWWPG